MDNSAQIEQLQAENAALKAAALDAENILRQTMTALRYSSLSLTASMDLHELLGSILQVIFHLVPNSNAHVFLYDGEKLSFGAVLRDGERTEEAFAEPRQDGLTYSVARNGTRIIVEDISSHPLYTNVSYDKAAWSGAIVGMPLKIGEQVVGVMNIGFSESRQFTPHELEVMELFALQAAIAIENARLYQQSQEYALQMEMLRDHDRHYYEELQRTRDRFVEMASHDIRSPINSIRGFAKLLKREHKLDPAGEEYIDIIVRGADQILVLVKDILDVARLETGMALALQPVDLNQLLVEYVKSFELMAMEKNVQLNLFLPIQPIEPIIDGGRFGQVIANLVSNAIKYTPSGGRVDVEVEAAGESAIFRVRDTGLGIPPEAMPNLFEKFYRVQSQAHMAQEGTGLGLSIVKTIVEQHNGTVLVHSTPGQGSIFTVTIPL